jgi:hypothetical protein
MLNRLRFVFYLSYKVGTVLACARTLQFIQKNMSNKIHYSLILILYSLAANAQSKSGH